MLGQTVEGQLSSTWTQRSFESTEKTQEARGDSAAVPSGRMETEHGGMSEMGAALSFAHAPFQNPGLLRCGPLLNINQIL